MAHPLLGQQSAQTSGAVAPNIPDDKIVEAGALAEGTDNDSGFSVLYLLDYANYLFGDYGDTLSALYLPLK
jgi:hypothetical protein